MSLMRSFNSPLARSGSSPFSELERIFAEPMRGLRGVIAQALPIRVLDRPEHYELTVEVPGARREDLKLDIDEHVVTIEHTPAEAEREKEADVATGRVLLNERSSAHARRVLRFDTPLAPEGHEARLENGVLTVHLHKRAPASTVKTIEIR